MKPRITINGIVLLLLFLIFNSVNAQVTDTDGEFENWTIATLSGLGSLSFTGYAETGSYDSHGGDYAVSLPDASADYTTLEVNYLHQSLGTEDSGGGNTVVVALWAKGSGSIAVGIWNGTALTESALTSSVSPFYTKHTFTFTGGATSGSVAHELRINTNATIIIDDVVVTPAGGDLVDVVNGDFETWSSSGTATLDDWLLNNFTSSDVSPTLFSNSSTFATIIDAGELTSGTGDYLYQSLGTASGDVVVDGSFYAASGGPNGIQVGVDDGSSFVFIDEFTLTTSYVQYFFTFDAASGETYEIRFAGGVGTRVVIDDLVVAENEAPTATADTITGKFETGFILTAGYTYDDNEGDSADGTSFQWYTATTSTGTIGKTAISGATEETYLLTTAEDGFHIGFEVTPAALTGTSPELTVEIDSYYGHVVPNIVPFLTTTVALTHASDIVKKQDATYNGTFSIDDDFDEVGYDWQWYKSDDASGTNKTAATGTGNSGSEAPASHSLPFEFANVATYTVDFTDVGKYLTLEITPTADSGLTPGVTVSSVAEGPIVGYLLGIPVLNLPTNGFSPEILATVFVWDENAGAGSPPFDQEDEYQIQVATDALFNNIVFEELTYSYINGINETVTASPDLLKNTIYYWRVRASLTSTTPITYSPWTSTWTFTTTNLTKPIISYPTNGAVVYTKTPTVYWFTGVINTGITFTVSVKTSAGGSEYMGSPYASGNGGTDTFLELPEDLIPGDTYYIEVEASDGFDTETSDEEDFYVSISVGGLVVPTPSYPIGGVTVYSETPTLYWYLSPFSSGLTYDVEVATDAGFGGSIVYSTTGLSNLFTTVSPALTARTTYYWHVRSDNGSPSAYSSTESFVVFGSTGGTVPPPILSWPIGGATVYTTSPVLYWYLSIFATGVTYEWEVYDDPGYTSLVTSGVSSTTSATASSLMEGTTYYWQVRTEQGGFFSSWVQNSFVTFTAFGGGGVPVPILSSPIGGAPTLYWFIIGSTAGITFDVTISLYPGLSPAEGGFPVTGVVGTSYDLSGLANGTTYYWSVRSYDGFTYSAWATSESFHTPVSALLTATPNPGSPIGGIVPETSSPELTWFVLADDSELVYNLEYAKNSDFVDAEQLNDIEANSVVISNLDGGETYFWRVTSKSPDGSVSGFSPIVSFEAPSVTGVDDMNIIPEKFDVAQNYPNPFNPSTTIRYAIPEATFVTIRVFDMLGQEVKTLINRETNAGVYNVTWNGTDNFNHKVSTGTYIYRVLAGENVITKKMVLLK